MRGNFITDRRGSKNPNYKHGLRKTRLFSIWINIRTRCNNPNSNRYGRYGGRGIKVCEEWNTDFLTFRDWALSNGYRDDLTIDRIDNDGNYCPENCRWVTLKEQARNTKRNVTVELSGEEKTLIEWCELYGINYKTVRDRLLRGWDIKRALFEPVQTKFRKKVG